MIPLGNTGLFLFSPRERWWLGREEILTILQRCKSDPAVLLELRTLLHYRGNAGSADVLSEEDVLLDGIASMILSGELWVLGTEVSRIVKAGGVGTGIVDRAPAPPLRSPAPARRVEPPPEPPTISPEKNHTLLLVAGILSAAESGVPFCEP